jgi:hypothetical protein
MAAPTLGQPVTYNTCPDASRSPMEQHAAVVTRVVTDDIVDLEVTHPEGGTYNVEFVSRGTLQGSWQE